MNRQGDKGRAIRLDSWPTMAVAAAITITALVFFLQPGSMKTSFSPSTQGCDDVAFVKVSAAAEVARPVSDLLSKEIPGVDRCTRVVVQEANPVDVVQVLAGGRPMSMPRTIVPEGQSQPVVPASATSSPSATAEDPETKPDLWIPDSSVWLSQVQQVAELSRHGSLASSPVILGTSSINADVRGWNVKAPTWAAAVGQGIPVALPENSRVAQGVAALAAIYRSQGGGENAQNWLSDVVLKAGNGSLPTANAAADSATRGEASSPVLPMSEQALVMRTAADQGSSRLVAVYPADGSPSLDYPIVHVAGRGKDGVLPAISEYLRSERARESLRAMGFRDPMGTMPINVPLTGRVAQEAPAPMQLSPDELTSVMQKLVALAKPARVLLVMDVSKSMEAGIPGGPATRADLARQAALGVLPHVPDSSALGVWEFAAASANDADDSRETASVTLLNQSKDGKTHRQFVTSVLEGLPGRLRPGGTALFDTAVTSVQHQKGSFNPAFTSTVVLVTDGANDKGAGRSLDQAVAELRALAGGDKPVVLHAIGLGPSSDMGALGQLAAATGGQAYSAVDETSLASVLKDVVRQRIPKS